MRRFLFLVPFVFLAGCEFNSSDEGRYRIVQTITESREWTSDPTPTHIIFRIDTKTGRTWWLDETGFWQDKRWHNITDPAFEKP